MGLPRLWGEEIGWGRGVVVTRTEYLVEQGQERLDLFLVRKGPGLTRSQVRRLLDEGYVQLNGEAPKPSRKIQAGDLITLIVPPPRPVDIAPEAIPLNIVFQDGQLLVVDKPAGLTVHPAPGHPSHTLVNALLALCPDLKGIGGELRPGIVHRLDKDTSGLMVVAKSSHAHNNISNQLKGRTVHKGYLALAQGILTPSEGAVDGPIIRDPRNRKRMAVGVGGRTALTRYKVVRYLGGCSLIEVFPETGRTHQIRVHMASIGYPLVGDAIYGGRSGKRVEAPTGSEAVVLGRHFLHAYVLGFSHPTTGEYVEFSSPLPEDLRVVLETLR